MQNWLKSSTEAKNKYLDFLVNSSFQGVNRFFKLPFENENDRTLYPNYYLPKVKMKEYNVKIDRRKFF